MLISATLLRNPSLLKVTSLFMAYGLWYLMSDLYTLAFTVKVPIIVPAGCTQSAHYTTITLRGPRQKLRSLDYTHLAARIPPEEISSAPIALASRHFSLPSSVILTHCIPATVIITGL
jgi:hypothetical protein